MSSLNTLIKRALHRHTILVLSVYANLSAHQTQWEEIMCKRAGRKENELKDAVNSIRALCQRGFAEFIADLKAAGLTTRADGTTGVIETTTQTVEYLERLPELRKEAASVLLSLGDGNWKMGEGTQIGKAGRQDIDEQTILEHFTYDVVHTTIQTLLALSRANKRPAFGSVFLLNNISYLRNHLLVEPRNDVLSLLSKPTREVLNSNYRIAKAGYFDTSFMPVLQALDDREKGKSATKEKLTRFYDQLEEVAERHKTARVLNGDDEGRETICDEVIKLVVPSLERFLQRNKDFSRNPQKYIKKSPEEVENLIKTFYYL